MTNGHLLVAAGPIAGIFLARLDFRKWQFYVFAGIMTWYLMYTPYLLREVSGPRFSVNRSIAQEFFVSWSLLKNDTREDIFKPIIDALGKSAHPGDSFISMVNMFDNNPVDDKYQIHIANYFDGLTGLSTLNLYDPEVYLRPVPDLLKTKFLLVQLPPSKITLNYLNHYGYSDLALPTKIEQNFSIISRVSTDEDVAYYLLANKQKNTTAEKIPKFVFPFWLIDGIMVVMIGLIVFDVRRKSTNRHS